jgi:hypothetical protein
MATTKIICRCPAGEIHFYLDRMPGYIHLAVVKKAGILSRDGRPSARREGSVIYLNKTILCGVMTRE